MGLGLTSFFLSFFRFSQHNRYTKPEVISTFSDASEAMLRDMNGNRSMTNSSMSRQFKLATVKLDYLHRGLHCYFVNFDARFFNSKCVSQAFVDLLRSTYVNIFFGLACSTSPNSYL